MKANYTKKIFDPVHGFIKLTEIEAKLVDSAVFQRLHHIRQLGLAYKVYPGATHSRFEHSLGVMHVASSIFDQLSSQLLDSIEEKDLPYFRQITRLAALIHDVGHLPFSHVAEKQLLGSAGHESWTLSIINSNHFFSAIDALSKLYPGKNVERDLAIIAIGESKLQEINPVFSLPLSSDPTKLLSLIVTGDFFGADRIDYLIRDARCTGVSYGFFDYLQLIESIRVIKEKDGFSLAIDAGGIPSCQALLLARHFMYERVYQHPTVKVLSYHMSHFMKGLYDSQQALKNLESYLSFSDDDILVHLKRAQGPHADALRDRTKRYVAIEIPSDLDENLIYACQAHQQGEFIYVEPKRKLLPPWDFPIVNTTGEKKEGRELFATLARTCHPRYAYIPADQVKDFHITKDKNL